jgi:hypothetical protein
MQLAKQKPSAGELDELVRRTAVEERRLLKRERRAEKRVASLREAVLEAEARLQRAQQRFDARVSELAEAERELFERRADRARGPMLDGDTEATGQEPAADHGSSPLPKAPVPPPTRR